MDYSDDLPGELYDASMPAGEAAAATLYFATRTLKPCAIHQNLGSAPIMPRLRQAPKDMAANNFPLFLNALASRKGTKDAKEKAYKKLCALAPLREEREIKVISAKKHPTA